MTEQVVIERMSYGAQGIGRLSSGKTVFVDGAVPQDTVSVVIDQEKSSFARGHVDQILEASPLRVPCTCAHGALCGGCPWQALSYEAQLEAKRSNVVSALTRTAKMDPELVEELVRPVAGSKRQWGYRNKLELTCFNDASGRLQLGFHAQGGDPTPAPDLCPVAVKAIQKAPKALRGSLRFAQGAGDLGIFRVGVRSSVRTRSTEVALWTSPGAFPRASVAKTLQSACSPTSTVRVLADPGKARKVKKVEVLSGKGFWEEELCGTRFMTSAPAFFQVNTAQAEKLIAEVMRGIAGVERGPGNGLDDVDQIIDEYLLEDLRVADLYSGGGTFGLPLALAGADVTAVESAGASVRDLRRNAENAGVYVDVIGGDTARELPALGHLDALVVDPPRAGLANGVVESIAAAGPDRVAYVSCDPQTWARDVVRFQENGYQLTRVQPVDLFPQTYHCEVASIFARC
ncbi:MAG: class I SAM-dependent RNA methyltransferase [Coriobacteriia bacterium]|nr:class I SAM-dependent RNA methyltransferase [Coriobacteriia bacterium]